MSLPERDELRQERQDKVEADVERTRRRDARNWAVFAILITFALLVFAVTIVKMTINR